METDPYIRVKVENIANVNNMGYLVLLRPENQDVVLPICIGPVEAQSIAAACQGIAFPRPITHDLFANALGELKVAIRRLNITSLHNGTFFAKLLLTDAAGVNHELDSRPSDGIAMAVRASAPIFVHDSVLEAAGVSSAQVTAASRPHGVGDDAVGEEEVEEPQVPLTPEEQLRGALTEAVRAERYEEAARIRDDLKRMQKEQN